jgi:hypothetical protein
LQPLLRPRNVGIRGLNNMAVMGARSDLAELRQRFTGLQTTIGNQTVLRMLSRSRPAIQTKLTINQPGDQYEREADRADEQVMRMPDSDAQD